MHQVQQKILACFTIVVTRLWDEKKTLILIKTKTHVLFRILNGKNLPSIPSRCIIFSLLWRVISTLIISEGEKEKAIKRLHCILFLQTIIRTQTLRIYITFSIAQAKMKISLSLFIFTHTRFKYLKRRINFVSNHGTHKKWKEKI